MTTHRPYTIDQKMADLLLDNNRLLTLFERLGIRLGFGERSVEEVCSEQGLSPYLMVAMCNIVTGRSSSPSIEPLTSNDLRQIVAYLRLSHHNYTEHYFPALHSHIHTMAAALSTRQQAIINSFYDIYEAEVMKHFHFEEQTVFPYIEQLLNGAQSEGFTICDFAESHSDIDEKLADLLNIIIKYLPDGDEQMVSHAVLRDIYLIEEELAGHTMIENRLLVPLATRIEKGAER